MTNLSACLIVSADMLQRVCCPLRQTRCKPRSGGDVGSDKLRTDIDPPSLTITEVDSRVARALRTEVGWVVRVLQSEGIRQSSHAGAS